MIKHAFIAAALILSVGLQANAKISFGAPRSLADGGLKHWSDSFAITAADLWNDSEKSAHDYAECAEVTEIPGTVLCFNLNMADSLAQWGRPQIFAEGLSFGSPVIKKQTLMAYDNDRFARASVAIGGLDMKSSDLAEFYKKTEQACAIGGAGLKFCLTPAERDAYASVVAPLASKYKEFAIIVVDHHALRASHELAHAQYFLDANYKAAVDQFWLTLSSSKKSQIKAALAQDYDVTNNYLVVNEMQAYLLEDGASFAMLYAFVPTLRPLLLKSLAAAGVKPVL